MRAAIVPQAGKAPVYGELKEPAPSTGISRIAVTAAALSPVVKARASGAHYSSSGSFPIGVGIDGVGRLDDGSRVYFFLPRAPYGSMAEKVVVPSSHCTIVPDGLDDITAAAIAIPGMSSWVALKERANFTAGETVLVNGATGTSGRLAVRVAKYLDAKKVIATGRRAATLESIKALGADETILLNENRDALEKPLKNYSPAALMSSWIIFGGKAPSVYWLPQAEPEWMHQFVSSRSELLVERISPCQERYCGQRL